MKTLILLRHAKATAGEPDHARSLTADGRSDATSAGNLLRVHGLHPAIALVSDAARTRQTFEGVAAALDAIPEVRFEHRLYDGTSGTILDLVRTCSDQAGCVLVVGHNPGVGEAARLAAAQGPMAALSDLGSRFATGTSAVIDFDVVHWAEVGRNGILRALLLADEHDL